MWKIRSRAAAAIAAMTAIVVSWGAEAQSLAVQERLHVLQDKCEFHANLAFPEWFEYREAAATSHSRLPQSLQHETAPVPNVG